MEKVQIKGDKWKVLNKYKKVLFTGTEEQCDIYIKRKPRSE